MKEFRLNNSMPLVSVIVLIYNNQKYLREALTSIYMQTYPNIEIIISDDGSHDIDMKKIHDEVKGQSNGNVYIKRNAKNVGTVKNITGALTLARGDIVKLLACDDRLSDSEVVEKAVNIMKKNTEGIYTGRVSWESGNQIMKQTPYPFEISLLNKKNESLYKYICLWSNCIPAPGVFFKREVFDYYPFDEGLKLVEDLPMWLNYLSDKNSVGYFNFTVSIYRTGGISTGNKKNERLEKDIEQIYQRYILDSPVLNKKEKRMAEFNYQVLTGTKKGWHKAFFYIAYLDIAVKKLLWWKVIFKLQNKYHRR